MKRKLPWLGRCALLALAALLGALPAAAKEGFGMMTKKAAAVTRVSPPAVFLMGTKIQVKADSAKGGDDGLAQRLRTQLESELISRDSRLTAEASRPETLIEVNILQNEANEKWETREEMRSRQVGKDSKGKPVYESYRTNVQYKVVSHSFAAAYKVTDLVKKASLDADSVQFSFNKDFREGNDAPEIFALEGSAINRAVESIARRITPTRETIHVLVPKGTLEDLGNLAEAGQWNLYLEALEKRPPSPKPADDSYRHYALGTAYEALGYAADEPEMTLKYLEQASIYYGKAIETNPGEKYFSQEYDSLLGNLLKSDRKIPPPLQRVQSALVSYRRLKDFQDNYDSLLASKAVESAKSLEPGGSGDGEAMDNDDVISMAQAGLEGDIILKAIDSAPRHQFDVSPQGLIALASAKVDKKIILRIQEIASGKQTGKKAAPAATTSKKKPASGR
jgi:tetratricopeptide (TPR) repeat protein